MTSDFLYEYIEDVNSSFTRAFKKLHKKYPNVPFEAPSIEYIFTMLSLATIRFKSVDQDSFLKSVALMAMEVDRGFAAKRYIGEEIE